MAQEGSSAVDSLKTWVSQHKLRTVGALWLTGLAGSFAYNWSQPNMKTSVKVIHARAQQQQQKRNRGSNHPGCCLVFPAPNVNYVVWGAA